MKPLRMFRVVEDGDVDVADPGEVIGWGIRFPSGLVALDWRRDVFPEDQQLDEPHLSLYGNVEDVATAIGGCLEDLHIRQPSGYSRRYPQGEGPENRPPNPSRGPKSPKSGVSDE